jgi:hypothetical protein
MRVINSSERAMSLAQGKANLAGKALCRKYLIRHQAPKGKDRKMALNLAQIKSIVTYDDGNETTFFSYLANGININDMLKLKYSNIVNNEIRFYRSKTIHISKEKKEIGKKATVRLKKNDSQIFGF